MFIQSVVIIKRERRKEGGHKAALKEASVVSSPGRERESLRQGGRSAGVVSLAKGDRIITPAVDLPP